MNTQKVVCFDLDGTLLTSNYKVSASSIVAIRSLQKRGIKPVIATGRNIAEIGTVLEETGINSCVAMNGQYVMVDGKVIYENPLATSDVSRLHQSADERNHELAFYTPHSIAVTKANSTVITENYIERVGTVYPPVNPYLYREQQIHLMVLFCREGEERYYEKAFPHFQYVRHSKLGCDVYPATTSKATGLMRLFDYEKISFKDTYAFGDGMNDIEMFGLVKYPIAMKNAVPTLKEKAWHVTKTNDSDGIWHGLKYCGLID
ncbi:Cof-type HAD-IIB family hydrolase [Exiguobacterium sp. s22]|uniref:Cof-type HAD-IIB family hydrolase n=1 Tax=Exiguobacterium sp. s22 TaxID=2751272 RepID=UPI001BEB7D11|nr:Cof-type HAD-IIB family hydrolase [Exiguobacterium sp. s22]